MKGDRKQQEIDYEALADLKQLARSILAAEEHEQPSVVPQRPALWGRRLFVVLMCSVVTAVLCFLVIMFGESDHDVDYMKWRDFRHSLGLSVKVAAVGLVVGALLGVLGLAVAALFYRSIKRS